VTFFNRFPRSLEQNIPKATLFIHYGPPHFCVNKSTALANEKGHVCHYSEAMGDEEKQSKIGTGKEEDANTSDGSLDLCHNDSVTGSVVDTLRERVKELEALVGGKEEALHVALQGLDSAMGVEVEYRAQLEGCRARVGEFQQAVQHRDQLIEQLSASLEHTLRARDELAQDGERLAQEVSLLRSQLQATSELMLALEDTSKKKDARIEELQRLLSEEQGAKKELEQKKGELTQYKSQAATHVQQLMQEVERLHREAVNSKTLERQRAQQVVGLEREHQRQLAELRAELEEQFGQQLMHIQENHRIQFSEQVLKQHQSEEVASISITTTTSSNDSDTQQQLQELSERALHVASEREDLVNQLALYKGQVQSLSEELLKYSSETNDSQQSLRVSLESENVSLKEQLHLLKEKLRTSEEDKTQELVMYQQAQASEVATWRKRVDSLTLELQKVSEVAESYLLRLEECTKVHETEITSLQEAHAKELAFLSGQMEGMKQFKVEVARLQEKLQEQTVMEKRLQNELETSIRAEEKLKGKLLEIQEERQVLRSAFEQQKELLHQQANNVEKLRNELQEKERSELLLREELKVLTDKITSAREGDAKLYKEQIDKLNEQLQQKVKTEELLKKQVLEREQVEQMLKKELEEQTDKYKSELNSVKQVLQEKVQIEDQLRTELQEKVQEGVLLQNELKAQKCALEELKKSTGEAEVYKTQVDSLNRQLQERSQSEHKIISDYESRVKALTFDLNTIESRLSSEVQDIQARAREELLSKQETERRLEGELEAVRNELLTLKTLPDVQEYKEQINKLNLLVQEKQKAEGALKAELQAVSAEVAALKENQQHLENLNSDLEERLRTEQRLQEELIAAAKMHKEQVDVLSAKINELTSQQNSLDNEAISMRQEIESQKSYIHDLELIREQVSQSAKTKEVLINDLSVCVKSLTEDNASYQLKLDRLNKRLDDECLRADENMMMREGYEKEISKHKQHIEELKNNLQEALKTRDLHLIEISECQQELKGYKEQLETLNNTFEEETSRLRQEYVQKMNEERKRAEELGKELADIRKEVSSYKEQIEKLNETATKKEKAEVIHKKEMAELNKELLEVKNNLKEKKNQIEEFQAKLTHVEDCQSKDVTMYTNKIRDLEAEISVKNEHIGKLSVQMEESACKFDDVNKLLLQAQQQFVQERENNAGLLWEKMSTDAKSRKPEDQVVEEEQMQNVSAMQAGLQELNVTQEKSPKDRDSLNFSSISETELLQLESKLQHALNEKNDIEKSFRDHINKLAENHQKEVNLYEEQLQAVHKKLEDLMKTHSQCESEKESLKTEIDKLLIDHEKTSSYKDKLKVTFEKLEELSQVHRSCHAEQEALKSLVTGLEKDQKEKDDLLLEAGRKYEQLSRAHGGCVSEKENFTAHINKLSARYENEITEYVQQLKEASEKIDELSRSNANCLAENGSLKESLTKMTEICEEVTLYKDQLRITNERLEEISKIHTECVSEKDSFVRKVSEQEITLQDQESVLQKKSEALDACQKDLTRTREYIELLKVNLQDEISKVRVELHNLVNICAPNKETMNEEDNKQKSSEESSFMNGKDNWSPDWSQKEGHGSLEQSFVSAATIHHDVSALRSHVERLVSDLHSIKQKSSATEGLLAAKEENEIILKKRIDHLQKELGKIDEEKKSSKEQLEELTVKFLTAQSLLAGKTEAESSLQKEVAEMEVGACNKCKNLEEEISRLNSKLLDSEEKLRNIERERDKIVNKYKQSEKDKEKLLEEKADLANAIEQLKTENSLATYGAESEGLLKMSQNSQNNLVLQYNVLLDEHRKLLAEKSKVEELLEERKAELVRMREQQNEISSTAGELRHEGMGVEKGTQEQLDSVKEEAACVQLREYNVNSSNLSTSLDFLDLGVRGLEESDAADAATVHAAGDAASSLKPNRSLHAVVLKLMQHCAVLDAAKRTLASECDALRGRLEEREAQELLFNEELAAANSRCEALELRLQDAQQQEPTREALAGAKMALQCELRALEGENCALKAAKVSLQDELLSLREELQHLKKMGSRNSDPKGLGQELAVKVTEVAILQEKLKVTERDSQMFLEDARRTREQLEAAWQEQADAEEQLGRTRCELAIAGLRRESKASGLDSSAVALPDAGESPVFHLHQEVHTMVEEMAQELVSLRRELQSERTRNEHMVLERSCTQEPLEMERKLKALMKSNLELLQEKQNLLDQLQKQQAHTLAQSSSSQEGPSAEVDLLAKLSVYREQHASLAEAVGSTGALQEALRQQKEELLALVQELFQQKCNLQAELQQLEDKLREREQMLQIQRVERKLDESLRESPGSEEAQKEADASTTELQGHLQTLREEMHRAHREAVARLKQHLDAEFSAREQALRAGFSAEMASAQATHREQLAKLQHALLSAEKELERLRNAHLATTLGSAGHMSTELSAAKERYEQELHTICSGLDEGQAHLFAVLKHLFEEFARQLVAGTTTLLQSQNEQLVEREVATLTSHHQQQLECLRATLEKEHLKTLQELENNEEVAAKLLLNVSTGVQLHSADSSQVALVQLKHLLYSEYTSALREVTKDWASAWKEEVHSQLEALEKALEEEAMALQLLRDSPEVQGSGTRDPGTSKTLEELLRDAEKLTTRAEELLERKVKVAEQALRVVSERLDAAFAPVAERTKQMASTHQISRGTNSIEGEAEKDQYRKLAQQLAAEHAAEAGRLRELLAQLEARRAREMEELRQYFEQKVQELEKHYSEEITSQHSRRHSSSSCDSDSEFTADALLGAGDHALNRIPPLTHICDSCAADPGYKELEERWKGELEKRVEESRSQLLAAKKELEAHYETELSTLRKKYEEKLGRLAQELSGAQQAAVQVAKASAGKCLQALWRKEVRAARTRLLALLSQNSPDSPIYSQAEESLDGKAESFESISNLVENDAQDQETLEDLCIELSSQLRQLEATCRQCLLKQKQQLQKVKEAHTEFALEEASTQSVEQVLNKVQLEEKLRREVRQELEQELEQQNMFIENQNQMMKEFLEQHRYDLESLKQQHRAELSKVRGGDRTIGMTQTDTLSLMRRHETSQTDQPKTPNRTDAAVSPKHFVKLHKQVQTEEPEPANVLMASQEVQTSPRKGSPALLDVSSTDRLRAQPFDGNSLSLLSDVVSLMEPAPEDGAEDEQEGADFRRTLMNIQSEYVNHLEAMLLEWLRLYQKMKNGQILGESDAKFLTREYVLDCGSKFKSVLSNLESIHLSEISNLQAALQRQRSSSRSPYNIQDDCNDELISPDKFAALIQERDHWRRVGLVLKKLVEELLTYLSECEDEVNQTFLSEGGVVQEEKWSLAGPPMAEEVGPTNSGPAMATPKRTPKRVRFAPTSFNFKDLVGNDDQMLLDIIREDEDLSGKLRAELDVCLEHLRAEAAALMENPLAGGQWAMDSTPSTPVQNTRIEGGQIEAMAQALTAAKQRIAHLETERRLGVRSEEVAEGFGEQPSSSQQGAALGLRLQSLSQLQDKARSMLAEGRPSSPQEAQQLRLLDEICREGDRLAEEARREREDLRQQVESADKRLRDTRRFLEEQAAEREQERDEFQQELLRLQEQLKAREKDLADQQRLSREVEALEQQGKEALARHQQLEAHREALQVELKAAVDKVWLLRDVVAELELQAEAKDARAAHLEARLESLRAEGGSEISRQVAALQEQLHAHRLQAEQCRPAAIKQMKAQIREMEVNVEKRTHQLEALHATSSNQSSPSEDVSVRDMFRSDSPEDMRAASASPSLTGSMGSSPRSPPPVPLPVRELSRLQERLQRHARAEEAALKKTRDLEMQLKAARRAEEEASAERDVLQERVSEQLLRIASLEALVDAGRWKRTSEEEEAVELEELREQQLLQQRAQDAEDEAERLAVELDGVRQELQHLKEANAEAEAAWAERERTLGAQLLIAQRAEAAAAMRCAALEKEGPQQKPDGAGADRDAVDKGVAVAGEASERERRLQQELGAARAEAAQLRAQAAEVAELESMAECLQTRMDAAADHLADMVDAEEAHADDRLAFLSGQLAAEKARSEELGARLRALEGQASGQASGKASSDASVAASMLPPEAEAALEEAARLRLQLQDALRERDELRRQCDAAAESAQLDSSLRDHITTVEEKGLAAHCGFDGEAATRDNAMHSLQHELYQIADNQPHTRHTIQLVQAAPIPSLTAPPQLVHISEQTLHMQQELQRLHQQLHQQLQQMQAAAQAHNQREHELATTILAEQERVSELQRALRKEQRHALDLQSQLASHAVRAGLAVDETRLHQASREAEQERARAQSLEQQLQQERAIIRQLKSAVLTERQRFQAAQRRDAELLQTLRLRLGEMAATTGDKLQQGSHRASTPVLPLSPVQLSSPPSSLEAALNVAAQSPAALQADAWASAEALAELQRRLSDAQEETRGLRRRLNREQETSQQLRAELNLVRGHNDALDTQTNVARLEAELAAERAVREDAVAESAQLQRDLEALRREADVAAASAATATAAAASVRIRSPPESPVEEPDMNASLDQQMRDHSKVALTLARLTSEGKARATVSRLTAEKASVMEECIALRLELARAKEELCRRHGETADTEELENRVNHLFGRYLRAESYRKALAWQKKYLLIALGGYQQTEAYTLSRLAHVGATIPHRISEQSSGRRRQARFRSAAFVIVAIHRMKFLIQRWYRGRQIGGSTVLNHAYSESVFSGISAQGLRRGGSSAPSVSSWSVPASASVSLGTVPHSPPSHDHSSYNGRSLHRSEATRLPLWRSMDGLTGSLPRSVTPSRLAQFVERCDSLQQRLGLATAPLVTLATSPSRSPHRGEN
ncbi:Uncharacterized protein GBIM_16588, partial [Gryllus bimaculatus]